MRKNLLFSLFLILINITLSSRKKFRFIDYINEEYIFSNLSNFNCNISNNYTTSFTAKICSAFPIDTKQSFSFSFTNTNSEKHKVKCLIDSNTKMRFLEEKETNIMISQYEETNLPTKDYCYKTICEFEGMIKNNFTILINNNSEINIDGLPGNIYLITYFYENMTLYIDKCYLVKNIFKQVSKYNIDEENKILTFLLITSIKAKVEKNEKLSVDILLQKKNGNSEKKNIICQSQYKAEPPKGKEEILAFYDCQVSEIANIGDYNGLNLTYSIDIQNIPINSDMNNPKTTDELIKEERVKDYSIITFSPKSIDFQDCEKSGKFIIKGNINGYLEGIDDFGIILFLNDSNTDFAPATCRIPSGYREELNMSCIIEDNYYNSKINIPNIEIIDSLTNETLIQINHISQKELTTCIAYPDSETTEIIKTSIITPIIPTTTIIKETTYKEDEPIITQDIIKNVVFRQINNLDIDYKTNFIRFNIIGFTFDSNLEKNMILPININLVNSNGNNYNMDLNCSLNNIINSSSPDVYSLIFICYQENIDNITSYKDVILISSPSLLNIPSIYSNLSSALNTDLSITRGSIKNFYEENILIEIPPIISSTSITSDNCRDKGVFVINGVIDKSIDVNLSFYLNLENLKKSVRCKMTQTEANSEVEINCNTFENLISEYISISSKIIYDIDLNELFYLNEVNTSDSIYCTNSDYLLLSKAIKKMESFVVFRQVSKFRQVSNRYSFFLASFIKKEINANEKISLNVEIKSSDEIVEKNKLNNKGRLLYFRKLSRFEEQTAECTVSSRTSVGESGLGTAGWDCITSESSIANASGLDIKESEDVSGIPDDPILINPAKTDTLIEDGTATDYSIKENLNELIPLFNTLELNYSFCRQNGSFSFIGNATSTIEEDVIFNITLSYPATIFACKLPRVLKDQITQIECYSKEEFQNYTILVEETVIRYNNKEYFILRNTSSGDRYVTCSSSNSNMEGNTYDDDFYTISKKYNNKNDSGSIGTAGIIVIIIFGIIIIVGIVMLIILLKRKGNKKKENENTTENKSIDNSSSSYY